MCQHMVAPDPMLRSVEHYVAMRSSKEVALPNGMNPYVFEIGYDELGTHGVRLSEGLDLFHVALEVLTRSPTLCYFGRPQSESVWATRVRYLFGAEFLTHIQSMRLAPATIAIYCIWEYDSARVRFLYSQEPWTMTLEFEDGTRCAVRETIQSYQMGGRCITHCIKEC